MSSINRISRKYPSAKFLVAIFAVMFALSLTVQSLVFPASADQPYATIDVNTINGDTAPFDTCLESPVTITGSGTINPAGQIEQYEVEVVWGNGDIEDNIPVTLQNSSSPYSYTFTAGPHNYTTAANSITIKIYHVNPPGEDGQGDDSETITVCITPPDTNDMPVIVLNGSNPMNLTVGDAYNEPGAVANDTEDGQNIVVQFITGAVNSLIAGVYQIYYNFTDEDGAAATQVTRTVNVNSVCSNGLDDDGDGDIDSPNDSGCASTSDSDENTPPSITLVGASPFQLTIGNTWNDPGANASDIEDNAQNIPLVIVVGGDTVDEDTLGEYDITYTVTDSDGASTQVTRTVNVIPVDTECEDGIDNDNDGQTDLDDTGCSGAEDNDENNQPIITLIGNAIINLFVGGLYTEEGATAADIEDNPDPVVVVGGDTVNTAVADSYVVTYNAVDSENVAATQVTRTVNVNPPVTTPPQCSDEDDNDADDLTDMSDPSCHTDWDAENEESYDENRTEVNDEEAPVSSFGENSRNYQIIETELVSLSLTGTSTDDLSGFGTATIEIWQLANEATMLAEGFFTRPSEEESSPFQSLTCNPVPQAAVQVLIPTDLPLNGEQNLLKDWTYNWTVPGKGVYCAIVHATDAAGNIENTAIAGPFAYNPVAPTPTPTPTPSSGGGGGGGGGGSYTAPTPTPSVVATASTPAPTPAGEVLGATTTLPATGASGSDLAMLILFGLMTISGAFMMLAGYGIKPVFVKN